MQLTNKTTLLLQLVYRLSTYTETASAILLQSTAESFAADVAGRRQCAVGQNFVDSAELAQTLELARESYRNFMASCKYTRFLSILNSKGV